MNPCDTKVSIWDLDNCLFDDQWRTPMIDWHLEGNERYERYDANMEKDIPAHIAEWRIITQLSLPVFITGRREKWREITRKMVVTRLLMLREGRLTTISQPLILMRPNECNERPVELKERLLKAALFGNHFKLEDVIAAFDDVPSIVEMYKRYGIPAAVLRVHDPKLAYAANDL